VTPNFATQAGLLPWAYQVPVACGGVLVLPGDVVVADGDGAVVVPAQLASETARIASAHEEWEVFSRERLDAGGALAKYYPLDEEATVEHEAWRRDRP
jgi:regulator of RNase E activity RraA